jgi:hypothetical protein
MKQPTLGLIGLTLVIPIAVALSIGAGVEGSVWVLAPLVTFSLPLVAMVAFWWADWPGTRVGANWSGWADTALVAVGAVVLTGIGQSFMGHLDLRGMFDPSPGNNHFVTFPTTMPLAGTAFIAMLELTLVGEGWPLRRLSPIPAGALAVAISWVVALVVTVSLVRVKPVPGLSSFAKDGPVKGVDLGALLVTIGGWQVLCFVLWRGWPFSLISRPALRLPTAHLTVIGGGLGTYAIASSLLAAESVRIAAIAGCFIASGLLTGMLFEGWFDTPARPFHRVTVFGFTVLLTAAMAAALFGVADSRHFVGVQPDDWVEHVALNALSSSIILHVAIGRRWPFARRQSANWQPAQTGPRLDSKRL